MEVSQLAFLAVYTWSYFYSVYHLPKPIAARPRGNETYSNAGTLQAPLK